jgi:hypothetical protein
MNLRSVLGIGIVASLALAGCGGSGGTRVTPDPTLRFVNAAPGSNPLSLFVDDEQEANGIAFLGSTPNFASLDAGDQDVSLRETGTTTELWAEVFGFNEDTHVMIVAFGKRDYGSELLKRLRFNVFTVDRRVPNGNKSRLVVFNGFVRQPGFDPIAVDYKNPGPNPQFQLADIPFGTSRVFEVDSGTQTFEVKRTGADAIYMTDTRALEAGSIYLVLITGEEGAGGEAAPRIEYIAIAPKS